MKGFFITFEGTEGSGKTTQIRMLDEYLRNRGFATFLTREPGGTEIGERIRSVLLNSKHEGMAPMTELLLYAASRYQHIVEKILPAIEAGKIVLCDRYADATTAYQGSARRIVATTIDEIHRLSTEGLIPNLTFLLDCPAKTGLARARERNARDPEGRGMDRFEREELDFHERVRQGYLSIAKMELKRFKIIDATLDINTMHRMIVDEVEKILKI